MRYSMLVLALVGIVSLAACGCQKEETTMLPTDMQITAVDKLAQAGAGLGQARETLDAEVAAIRHAEQVLVRQNQTLSAELQSTQVKLALYEGRAAQPALAMKPADTQAATTVVPGKK